VVRFGVCVCCYTTRFILSIAIYGSFGVSLGRALRTRILGEVWQAKGKSEQEAGRCEKRV
jgi:hypothetical protein